MADVPADPALVARLRDELLDALSESRLEIMSVLQEARVLLPADAGEESHRDLVIEALVDLLPVPGVRLVDGLGERRFYDPEVLREHLRAGWPDRVGQDGDRHRPDLGLLVLLVRLRPGWTDEFGDAPAFSREHIYRR